MASCKGTKAWVYSNSFPASLAAIAGARRLDGASQEEAFGRPGGWWWGRDVWGVVRVDTLRGLKQLFEAEVVSFGGSCEL